MSNQTKDHTIWLTTELSTIRDRTATLWSDSLDYRDHSTTSALRAKLIDEQLHTVLAHLSIIAQAHRQFLIDTEVLTQPTCASQDPDYFKLYGAKPK